MSEPKPLGPVASFIVFYGGMIAFVAGIAYASGFLWRIETYDFSPPSPVAVKSSDGTTIYSPSSPLTPPKPDPNKVFQEHVQPILQASLEEDHKALDRFTKRVHELFSKHHQAVDPFVDEMLSWSMRFGVLWRTPGDWWYETNNVGELAKQSFESHLFSSESLAEELASEIEILREDLDVNRNKMIQELRVAVSRSEMPEIILPDLHNWLEKSTNRMHFEAQDLSQDSAVNGVATLGTSVAMEIVVQAVIVNLLAQWGSSAAATASTAGGATAAGGAAGAGGGSLGGPLGIAIGASVGVVIGMVVDWWATERCRDDLTVRMHKALNEMESQLTVGTPASPGLKPSLNAALESTYADHERLIRITLQQGIQGR